MNGAFGKRLSHIDSSRSYSTFALAREKLEVGLRMFESTVLLAIGNVTNQRENGEELLGRNCRYVQTQMLEDLKLGLSHVIIGQ